MESNCCLVFFLFGLSMLPKIYSDAFPSLVLVKKTTLRFTSYDPAAKIEYAGDENNLVQFQTSSDYTSKYHILYNACPSPRQYELHPWTFPLKIKGQMTDLQPTTLERFVTGLFDNYDCYTKMKPIALKFQGVFGDKSARERFPRYDIGFVVHQSGYFEEDWTRYVNAANERLPKGYGLVKFLSVTLDKQLGTIYSVSHEILSGQFLQPYLVFDPLPPNEKNFEEYGFDVDSLYTEENQRNILYPIFGEFNSEHRLIKVQLAPYQDFLLDTWKLTSFTDLNTVPMWKLVYYQWLKIEEFVRKVARQLGNLSIETGTAKILELHDVRNQPQQVYLGEDRKLAVSKYVWKHVTINQSYFNQYPRAILIVMHNDPYTPNQKQICGDDKDYGWSVSNNDIGTGLTYVCPLYEDIRSKLDDKLEVSYKIFKLNNMQNLDDSD